MSLFESRRGSGPRCAAILATVLAGAKRHRIEPWAYLRDLLVRLHADDSRLDEMLPDRWAKDHPESELTYRLEESRQNGWRIVSVFQDIHSCGGVLDRAWKGTKRR